MIDWNLLRELLLELTTSGTLRVRPESLKISIPGSGPPPMPSEQAKDIQRDVAEMSRSAMGISFPKGRGREFDHWEIAWQLGLIRSTHDGKPGFGQHNIGGSGAEISGLTLKGRQFLTLIEPKERWREALRNVSQAKAATFENLSSELRRLAKEDIKRIQEQGSSR